MSAHEFTPYRANPTICSICGAVRPGPCYNLRDEAPTVEPAAAPKMTPLTALREIRSDAERDVRATDGRTMNGRVMGEYIGNTAALICALSSVMEDMLMRMQTVGPDDVVLITLPPDAHKVEAEVTERLVDRMLALGLHDRFLIVGGGITATVIPRPES